MARQRRHAALVDRLQREIEQHPRRYRLRLALLAGLGHGVLLLLLLLGLGLPLLALGHLWRSGSLEYAHAYAVLVPGLMGVMLLRAVWVRFGVPEGYRLAPGDAPELEARIEALRRAAGAPPLKGIVIDGELNAAAASVPRGMGLLGHDLYLVLGLPLLRVLDPEELAAVIGHEFGHFGQRDSAFSGWIYRVRLSWYRVLDALAGRGMVGSGLLVLFYRWYVPYFNACSFALARHHEYGADAMAARLTSPETAARALARVETADRRLQAHFWPRLRARMRAQRHPLLALQAELARHLEPLPLPALERLMAVGARPVDPDDTHPGLRERLQALNVEPALHPIATSAAQAFLAARLPAIEQALDTHWRTRIDAAWRHEFEGAAAQRARLDELERHVQLEPVHRVEHARLVESLRPDMDALPIYRSALAHAPDSALAHLRAGALQLEQGAWDEALGLLQRALELDPGAAAAVSGELRRGLADPMLPAAGATELAALASRLAEHAGTCGDGDEHAPDHAADPSDDGAGPALSAHALAAAELDALARAFAFESRIACAWVARRPGALAEEHAHFLVLLQWRGSVASEAAVLRRLQSTLALPGAHTVLTDTQPSPLTRRIKAACPAPAYARARR